MSTIEPEGSSTSSSGGSGLTIVVTGSSSGVGYAACAGLAAAAASSNIGKIVCTARSTAKGEATVAKLVAETGQDASLFDFAVLDLDDYASVAAAVQSLPATVDRLVLNAGNSAAGMHSTSGVTKTFQSALGHAVLVDGLVAAGKLSSGSRVLYASGEPIRQFLSFTGLLPNAPFGFCCFGKAAVDAAVKRETCDVLPVRGQLATYIKGKLVGTLHFSHLAAELQDKGIYVLSMSPGGTAGTSFSGHVKQPVKCMLDNLMCLFQPLGVFHAIPDAVERYVALSTGAEKFPSGAVAMSGRSCGPCLCGGVGCLWGAKGPLVDNRVYDSTLRNAELKAHAAATVREIAAQWRLKTTGGGDDGGGQQVAETMDRSLG